MPGKRSDHDSLVGALTRDSLREAAGPTTFERGEAYYRAGQVSDLLEHDGVLTGKVLGSQTYRVKLWANHGTLEYDCTCPAADEYGFCKHCVAAGLAWLARRAQKGAPPSTSAPRVATLDDVRAWLEGQDKGALVRIILDQAAEDDRLRERLQLRAAHAMAKGVDVAAYRKSIRAAAQIRGYVEYDEAEDYAAGLEDVGDSLAELVAEGFAAEAVGLADYAIREAEEAYDQVDDSDGYVGGAIARLEEVHYDAVMAARPDPQALAKWLFDREMTASGDTRYDVEDFAEALGAAGLAAYRRLAEAEWAKVPPRKAGEQPGYSSARYRITRIMEALAHATGDVDQLVAIKSRDLSTPNDYLEIARAFEQAGRHDEALNWAERGVAAFVSKTAPYGGYGAYRLEPLEEFLADAYHERGRHDDAMAVLWRQFEREKGLVAYQALKKHAERAGQWPPWRAKALDALRALGKQSGHDNSELVRALLWEGDVEAAWQAAREGGCAGSLWLELADRRGATHPQEALPLYMAEVDRQLQTADNSHYMAIVALLRKMKPIMEQLGWRDEFAEYVGELRANYKRRRNFIELLDQAKLLDRKAA